MITIPITLPWHICTPTVFRFLPAEYVQQFFADGSLRLSSFSQFKQHRDEQRLDLTEGQTCFVHRTERAGGQTFFARAHHGDNAYVLCTTMLYSRELMTAFNCDSYIRINDPTDFGVRVARHIPGFQAGAEGPCLYQDNKVIEHDLGYIDVSQFADPASPSQPNRERLERFINDQMKHYPFFIKHSSYSHQIEYRFVWITSSPTKDFLDVKVPEVISICSKPNSVTE
jgi:hypothetical protein